MFKKGCLILVLMVVLSSKNFLQADFGDGKYAGEFISYSVDARNLALGNLNLTSFYNSSMVYWNPAVMPFFEKKSITASHSERFEGELQQDFLSFNTKLAGTQNIGVALIRIGVDDIKKTSELINEYDRPDYKLVSDSEFAFFLAYGAKYREDLSLGASVKFLGKFLDEESAYGVGFDISALYLFNENMRFGAKVQDVTTSLLSWSTGLNEYIKPSLLLSGEYSGRADYFYALYRIMGGTKVRSEGYSEHAAVSAGVFDMTYNVGLELLFKNVVFLRGGYDSDNTWAAGTGIRMYGANLDYTFKPDFEDLGVSHKVTLSYGWGEI